MTKKEKKTLINETDKKKAMKKKIKMIKTLKEYFVNRSIIIFRNKKWRKNSKQKSIETQKTSKMKKNYECYTQN